MDNLRRASDALTPGATTILRITVGVVMAVHGWLKLTDFGAWQANVEGMNVPAPDVLALLSMAAELAGGIGLIVGFLTPIAAFGVLCNMIVAIAMVHWKHGLLAQHGGFEYPLVLGATALYFLVHGAGPISLDNLIFGGRRRRARERAYAHYGREVPAS